MNKFEQARLLFRHHYESGITPVDSRKPIADELAKQMVSELIDMNVDKDLNIGVIDAFMILSTHLKEAGFNNLTLIENNYEGEYYNNIQSICKKSGINYTTDTTDMKFDVIIGNPPYQNGKNKSTTNSLWKEFLKNSVNMSDIVYLVLPDIALAPPTFSIYKDKIAQVNLDVKKHFKGVGSGFCSLLITNDNNDTTKIITKDDVITIDRGSLDCIPLAFDSELLEDMNYYLRGIREWKLTYEYESRKKVFCDDGQYEVLHTSSNGIFKTNVHHSNNDLIRVSVDVSGNPKFHYIHNMGLTQSHYWTEFDNETEAIEYVEWGNSDRVQSFLKKVKWGGMNSAIIIKNLI